MPVEERIAGLRTILCGGPDRDGGGDGPLVCLLHGYGAGGDDLFGLWRVLDVPRQVRFAFPEAPHSLAQLFGFPSFAWWHIDVGRFAAAAAEGRGAGRVSMEDLYDEEPEGLPEVRAQVLRWLAELRERLGGLQPGRVVLGGFSQGAMLALDTALHLPVEEKEPLAGLLLLSGALVNRRAWRARLPHALPCPRFQSHGLEDDILPFSAGAALDDFLRHGGFPGELYRFHGGHEISPAVLSRIGAHVTAWLGL